MRPFNIKSGFINAKNKAAKALNEITGIILNNMKKESNGSGNSISTSNTCQKPG